MGGRPVRVLARGDEVVGAEAEGVGFLGGGAGDGDDFAGAEGFGEEQAEVPQAPDSRDADAFAGTAAVVLEGRCPKVRIDIQMLEGGQAEVPLGLRLSVEIPPGGIS